MEYKVAELEGALLDAAAAKAEGWAVARPSSFGREWDHDVWCEDGDSRRPMWAVKERGEWAPSRQWEHGGPIIQREQITVVASTGYDDDGPLEWSASVGAYSHYIDEQLPFSSYKNEPPVGSGPTPLIAAMRAYVASKFGETVELP